MYDEDAARLGKSHMTRVTSSVRDPKWLWSTAIIGLDDAACMFCNDEFHENSGRRKRLYLYTWNGPATQNDLANPEPYCGLYCWGQRNGMEWLR